MSAMPESGGGGALPGMGGGVVGEGTGGAATSAGWAGTIGGAKLTPMSGPGAVPGNMTAIGDPYKQYPVGLEQTTSMDCSDTALGEKLSGVAIVPGWAVSFAVWVEGAPIGASFSARVIESRPTGKEFAAFADDVTLSKHADGEFAVVRDKPCSPGCQLRLRLIAGTSGADTKAVVVFVFSPAAAAA